ncbi:acylphosphatase [Catenibacillus scindens]|uniref:Acylphosphatase n=1 Tax=Catenibacillus scindens TaxID=673271 RepID=A0A7W8HDR5_9FIRM|nr:DUF4214 domain-containing protein [Catenibacillus scindens]MBB5266434.1 acylphosphatase [Catenibacillus scindens]
MKKKLLIFALSVALGLGLMSAYGQMTPVYASTESILEKEKSVEDFVGRLYTYILGRPADEEGLTQWSAVLRSGEEQGAKVAQGFIESPEFQSKTLSDREYVEILYRTFFDREADDEGLAGWLDVLDSGLSRMHVFKGFAESEEFDHLCAEYGIIRGNAALTAPMDQNEGVTKFLVRCYRLCLVREADSDGLNAWCSQILSGANTAKEAAYGFVFSQEFTSKNLSDEEYVRILYRVFMDREADEPGLQSWVRVLSQGGSRVHVFNGFADSTEFQEICDSYGIASGSGITVGGTDETPAADPGISGNSGAGENAGAGNNAGNGGNTDSVNDSSQSQTSTVYYTPNGKKYHSTPNCPTLSRSRNIYSTSLTNAQASGRTACKVCH